MDMIIKILENTGFAHLAFENIIMIVIGCVAIYLAIVKKYEPLLLLPIGFGVIVGNIPYPAGLPIGVYDTVENGAAQNSVFSLIYYGVTSGMFPPLIFLGIGALTDFSSLISSPKSVLLGAAAQVGIFATYLGALILGFSNAESASIGIIGGADGPTSIFLSSQLAPDLLGPIAIAAYSYMALVPVIQPPLMKLLTTKEERLIRMKPPRQVSKREKILFPIIVMIVSALIAPGSLSLVGMLMLGNLLKESGGYRATGQNSRQCSARHQYHSAIFCRRCQYPGQCLHQYKIAGYFPFGTRLIYDCYFRRAAICQVHESFSEGKNQSPYWRGRSIGGTRLRPCGAAFCHAL
jgi:carboxybiotin decarboxylase